MNHFKIDYTSTLKKGLSFGAASAWAAQMSYAHIGSLKLGEGAELVGNMNIVGLQSSERYASMIRVKIPRPVTKTFETSKLNISLH